MERVLGGSCRDGPRSVWSCSSSASTTRQDRGSAWYVPGVLEKRIRRAIEAVVSPDEDRILRAFLSVILAALRTNYFRRDADGKAARLAVSDKTRPQQNSGSAFPACVRHSRNLRAWPAR